MKVKETIVRVDHPRDCRCVIHRPTVERLTLLVEFILDGITGSDWREQFEEWIKGRS